MPANVQSMAYYGAPPWHGLGTKVPLNVSADEMIRAAGLDWEVKVQPAQGAQPINKKGQFSRYEVIRTARPEKKEEAVLLGLVSRKYRPLQNTEAFRFFDPIVAKREAHFETAGSLGEGERVWVMAQMPGAMEIVRGDECMKYLLLSNTHNGDGAVTVKFTSIRVVCQNTLMLAMKDGQKAYRVRHSKKMLFQLGELSELLNLTQEVFQETEQAFQRLAKVQLNSAKLEQYFAAVFPRTKVQEKKGCAPPAWSRLHGIFDTQADLLLPGVRGTLWGAYNAITRYEDYKEPKTPELPGERLERTCFGGSANTKLIALQRAQELALIWNN